MDKVLNFFGSYRGLVLTLVGAKSGGLGADLLNKAAQTQRLEPVQILVLYLTAIVTAMTIISYLYKFIKWCKNSYKCYKYKESSS